MTKIHFIAIANILNNQQADKALCWELAYQFKKVNSNFDICRFITACGH